MFCPQCGAEFREGFDRCNDCDVALTPEPPPEPSHEGTPYVAVFETSEPDVIPVIKSLLRGAEIPFVTEGEGLMNLVPFEALGTIIGPPHAGVIFKVPEAQAETARQLLAARPEDFEEPELAGPDDP